MQDCVQLGAAGAVGVLCAHPSAFFQQPLPIDQGAGKYSAGAPVFWYGWLKLVVVGKGLCHRRAALQHGTGGVVLMEI
eukprot:2572737-Amphidinium_carterae.1